MPPAPPLLLRRMMALAWPIVLSRSAQAVVGFSDALMTAPLGEDALAAATNGSMNFLALAMLPMGIAFIVQSFAAQLSGAGDLSGARRYGWYAVIFSAVAGLAFVGLIPAIDPLLQRSWFAPPVQVLLGDYLGIRMLGMAAVIGQEALGNWYGGLGNTRLQMLGSLIAMTLNVALNWLLIEGHLGFPALGVSGAAIASVIAGWVAFAVLLGVFVAGRRAAAGRLRMGEFLRMIRFGVPSGINWFLEFGAFMWFIDAIVADLGTVTLAAFMVVIQVNSVAFMPAFGFASAGAIEVGQAIGSRVLGEVGQIVRTTLWVTGIWQLSVGVFYVAFAHPIMTAFTPRHGSAELVSVGAPLLVLSAAWQLFDAVAMTLSEALRAAGDTVWPMVARLLLAWLVFVPAGYWAVGVMGWGGSAAICAVVGYLGMLAAGLGWRYRSGAWRSIDLTGRDEVRG